MTVARLQIKEGLKFQRMPGYGVKNNARNQTRQRITARLIQRGDVVERGKEMCWMVLRPFTEALVGSKGTYVKTDLLHDF
jgi:hypothetical protein